MGKIYTGDANGIAREVKGIYIGDSNGVARRVLKGYVGDANGIARQFYEYVPPFDPTLPGVTVATVPSSDTPPVSYNFTTGITPAMYANAVANGYTQLAFDWSATIVRNADAINVLNIGTSWSSIMLFQQSGASASTITRTGSTTLTASQLNNMFHNQGTLQLTVNFGSSGGGINEWRNIQMRNVRWVA